MSGRERTHELDHQSSRTRDWNLDSCNLRQTRPQNDLGFSPVAKHETDEATERTSQAAARQAGALGLSFEARFQEAVRDLRVKPGSQHSWSHQETKGRE